MVLTGTKMPYKLFMILTNIASRHWLLSNMPDILPGDTPSSWTTKGGWGWD
jgi:hypothetical protein